MQKVISSSKEEMLESCNYIKSFHVNKLPRPLTVVSKEEFENFTESYYPDFIGIGQIHGEEDKALLVGEEDKNNISMVRVSYNFYDNCGYAKCKFNRFIRNKEYSWKPATCVSDVVYIKFGCQHDARLVKSDAFERRYVCEKCGCTWSEQTGY